MLSSHDLYALDGRSVVVDGGFGVVDCGGDLGGDLTFDLIEIVPRARLCRSIKPKLAVDGPTCPTEYDITTWTDYK